jgi:hypothetical protein
MRINFPLKYYFLVCEVIPEMRRAYRAIFFLILETSILFSTMAIPIYIATKNFRIFISSTTLLAFSIFLIEAILTGIIWYLTLVKIGISLRTPL